MEYNSAGRILTADNFGFRNVPVESDAAVVILYEESSRTGMVELKFGSEPLALVPIRGVYGHRFTSPDRRP